jgi:Zn-finger nucleic acid-binding protein
MTKLNCPNCNNGIEKLNMNKQEGILTCPICSGVILKENEITKNNVNSVAAYIDDNDGELFLNRIGFKKVKKSWAHTGVLVLFAPLILFYFLVIIFIEDNKWYENLYYSTAPIFMTMVVIKYFKQGKKPKYKKV